SRSKELASITPRQTSPTNGFVLDYLTLNTGLTNYTFQGNSTYFISGVVNLSGVTTFEGGSAIKLDTSATPGLWILGSVNCQATAYRPVVLTGKDDDTIGEVITGSTGSPTPDSYGDYAINIYDTASGDTIWSNLRFSYLRAHAKITS